MSRRVRKNAAIHVFSQNTARLQFSQAIPQTTA
jgi:hypothetical protein